jgi:hypothetical protein
VRALLIILLFALAGQARADDELVEAKRLEAVLEYERALALVDRAIAHGGAAPGRLAELHLLAGKLAAGLDRTMIAEDHFARLLALQPDVALPDGTSPKITAPFEAARARIIPLHVTATISGGFAAVSVESDPLSLVAGIHVRVVDPAGRPSDVDEPHALRIQLPPGTAVREIVARDANGNDVWVAPAPPEPTVTDKQSPESSRSPNTIERQTPLYGRWGAWAIATGVALASGGVCAWRFGVAQNQWNDWKQGGHDYSDLVALEDRGRRWGLAANISFGVAAATGITTMIVYLTHRAEPPVTVTVTSESLGVAGRF